MSDKTGIEWTDATWNPLRGCTRVSEGCRNCYAEGVAARFSGSGQPYEGLAAYVGADRLPRWTGKVALVEHALDQPLRWKKPRRIFVNSMSDLFHESVPDKWIDRIFAVMALSPQHTFQVLTKRPERMRSYINDPRRPHTIARAVLDLVIADFRFVHLMNREEWPVVSIGESDDPDDVTLTSWPLRNVWLGVSVEDQATADERIPLLLETPAAKRFVSAEPLLGPVDLERLPFEKSCDCTDHRPTLDALTASVYCPGCCEGSEETSLPELDWVIVGGESGPNARPMHPDWARSLRNQCADAGVPFFFKQWGEWGYVMQAGDPGFDEIPFNIPADAVPVRVRDDCIMLPDGRLMEKYLGRGAYPPEARALVRVGKKATGATLDGREHREFPA